MTRTRTAYCNTACPEDKPLEGVLSETLLRRLEAAAETRGFESVKGLLEFYYHTQGKSQVDMGLIFSVGTGVVSKAMRLLGVKARRQSGVIKPYWWERQQLKRVYGRKEGVR